MDIMRASQPGTQFERGVFARAYGQLATGLKYGLNLEAYVQTRWNESYFPPTGS